MCGLSTKGLAIGLIGILNDLFYVIADGVFSKKLIVEATSNFTQLNKSSTRAQEVLIMIFI